MQLFTSLTYSVKCQPLLSMEFSRQEYWGGLPVPTPGDFPSSEIEPTSLTFPVLADGFFTMRHLGSLIAYYVLYIYHNSLGKEGSQTRHLKKFLMRNSVFLNY